LIEVLYEMLLQWFHKKVVDSNRLARFFGYKKGKGETSKLSRAMSLNEMSLDNSKNHLAMDD
jgi:hypothetical protein